MTVTSWAVSGGFMRTGSFAQSMPLAQDLSRKKPSRPAAMLSEGMTAEGRR